MISAARDHGCSMRIGVNAGSLEKHLLEKYAEPCPEALVESALEHARILQDNDFHEFKISVKASDVFLAVAAYHQLADAIDCPLHIGITEAGGMRSGTVKSAIGLGGLLWAGIEELQRQALRQPVRDHRPHHASRVLRPQGQRLTAPISEIVGFLGLHVAAVAKRPRKHLGEL